MTFRFQVTGMTCAACSARVEKVTQKVPGVERAEVNLLAGTMVVTAGEDVSAQIIEAVRQAGYNAFLQGEKAPKAVPENNTLAEMKRRIVGSAVCLVVLMYFTMGHMVGLPVPGW